MSNFKQLFQIPEEVSYLNHAFMSPQPLPVEEAGLAGMNIKKEPWKIMPNDFFDGAQQVRNKFGQLINAPANGVAIIPSASYGLMAACNNVNPNLGDHGIAVAEEFPSEYYALESWCQTYQKKLITIHPPEDLRERGKIWNERLLEAIQKNTAVVVLSNVHWTNGTSFDLAAIAKRCRECEALLIIDGSQSIGAMPYNQELIQADALICAGYKWLMGPYSTALAYFGPAFDNGKPLEVSWLNKKDAINFHKLTAYTPFFENGAARYNMGEYSQFIHMPMLSAALDLLLEWTPARIQDHGIQLSSYLHSLLNERGLQLENSTHRCGHIMGFLLPAHADVDSIIAGLRAARIFVSRRGDAIRTSFHLYNDKKDVDLFYNVLQTFL